MAETCYFGAGICTCDLYLIYKFGLFSEYLEKSSGRA
jgi:hypothetical protein